MQRSCTKDTDLSLLYACFEPSIDKLILAALKTKTGKKVETVEDSK